MLQIFFFKKYCVHHRQLAFMYKLSLVWEMVKLSVKAHRPLFTLFQVVKNGSDSELPLVSASIGFDARTVCPADLLAQVSRLSGGTTPPLPSPSPLSSFCQQKTRVQNGAA